MRAKRSKRFRNPNDGVYLTRFQGGEDHATRVIEEDYGYGYYLQSCLAKATAGQKVAVGQLDCHVPIAADEFREMWPDLEPNESAFTMYRLNVIVLPHAGIWICTPVFDDIKAAQKTSAEDVRVLEYCLENSIEELPIHVAFISMLHEDTRHHADVFTTSIFTNTQEQLIASLDAIPSQNLMDRTIDQILEAGFFRQTLGDDSMTHNWETPTWIDFPFEKSA